MGRLTCPFTWRHVLKQMGISVKRWRHSRPRKDLAYAKNP
nr:MAG TPA: hypothetical protein [Caudoviricetes sp.]